MINWCLTPTVFRLYRGVKNVQVQASHKLTHLKHCCCKYSFTCKCLGIFHTRCSHLYHVLRACCGFDSFCTTNRRQLRREGSTSIIVGSFWGNGVMILYTKQKRFVTIYLTCRVTHLFYLELQMSSNVHSTVPWVVFY